MVCEEDSKKFLDAKDREVLDKEIDDAAREKKKHASFMKALTPLRDKVLQQQKQEVSSMASVTRTRGLVAHQRPDDSWSQEFVNQWVPPGRHVYSQGFFQRQMAYQVALWQSFPKFRNIWSARVCSCMSEDCMGVAYCLHWRGAASAKVELAGRAWARQKGAKHLEAKGGDDLLRNTCQVHVQLT